MKLAMTADQISNSLDYFWESQDIEADADAAFRQMREDDEEWAQTTVHEGYTVAQLRAAFDSVKSPDHWKNPIQAGCHKSQIDITKKAIIFHTGSVPTFTHLHNDWYLVEAAGYFATCGA